MTSPFKVLEKLMVKDLTGGVPLKSTTFRFVNVGFLINSFRTDKRHKEMKA
jgi:hypothetical protein